MEQIYIIVIGVILLLVGIYAFIKSRENLDNTLDYTINNITKDDKTRPSYWYNYLTSDTRSKCFDCDASSNQRHGSQCFDCEIQGGRKVNKLLNRVLTR
jgi:hypothetical protein